MPQTRWTIRVGDQFQPKRDGAAKQVNRSAKYTNRERGAEDAVLFPVCTSFSESVAKGHPLEDGYRVKRTVRPGG